MADQGTFIVLEGADGSGKGTQFRLLHQRLEAVGYEVAVFDFPRYDEESSYFVRQYLNGEYGPAASISPYTASLFYALDRYQAAPQIKQALSEGKIVLANRYVGSNMAHMGSKIEDPIEQRSFFVWEDSLEFQLLNLPRPNLNIFLHVPAEVSYELVAKKAKREYTAKSRDEHEGDMQHLKRTVSTYELLCQLFPNDFVAVDCMMGTHLLDIPEINNRIWSIIKPYLPQKTQNTAHSVTLKLDEAPKEPKKSQPQTKEPKQAKDDVGLLSLDLLSHIQTLSPTLVDYNLDWRASGFKYLTPTDLDKKLVADYKRFIEEAVTKYKAIPSARKHLFPGAALLKARLSLNSADSSLITLLENIGTDESRLLLHKIKQTSDTPAEDKPKFRKPQQTEPEQLGHILSKLAKDDLNANLSNDTEPVRLFEAIPRNEFRLLADIVYPFSSLSLAEVQSSIDKWSYQQKAETLQAAIMDKSKVLDDAYYRFDLLLEKPVIHDLLKKGVLREASLQTASPRFGYDMPSSLTAEEETELETCFDNSLEMFSHLQSATPQAAPLAVLSGHKLRIHAMIDFPRLSQLDAKSLPSEMHTQIKERVAEVHPILGSSLDKETAPEAQPPKKSSRGRKRRGNRKRT